MKKLFVVFLSVFCAGCKNLSDQNTATPPENNAQKFEYAVSIVLANEGGLSVNQYDSGGITKFGISQASYPHLDIKNLTIDQAKEIYKRDFWEANLYEKIQEVHLAAKVFDLSVNVGAKWANRLLQRALKSTGVTVIENGILDAQNITAINQADPTDLLAALKSEAAGYYRTLSTIHPKDSIFLRGWLKRGYG